MRWFVVIPGIWFGMGFGASFGSCAYLLDWIWDIWGVLLVYLLDALTVCFGLVWFGYSPLGGAWAALV